MGDDSQTVVEELNDGEATQGKSEQTDGKSDINRRPDYPGKHEQNKWSFTERIVDRFVITENTKVAVISDSGMTVTGTGTGVLWGLYLSERVSEDPAPFTIEFWVVFTSFIIGFIIFSYTKYYGEKDS